DLVFGHAVLHHLPDLRQAFREFARVLRPGGTLVFAGEPSRVGDRLAAVPKRTAVRAAPVWRALVRAREASNPGGHGDSDPLLEQVDNRLLEPRLPPAVFYNLMVAARRR